MADASLTIKINTDPAQPLQLLVKEAKQAEKEVEGLGSAFAKVGAAIAGLAVLKGTFDFVLNATRQMEDLTTQFIAFTGSAEGASRQLERLAEFAATSPFELTEVATANRTLLAFGSTTSQSIEQLRQLGEVSAATGTDLSELAIIFGQIQAEGKLTGERFNQLVERGVNIGPVLAETLGVAEGSLRRLREQGKITGDDVALAFQKMTSEGGQFFGATDRLSKTISGRLSTLKDSFTALASAIGNEASPVFGGYIDLLSDGVNALNSYIKAQKELEQGGAKAKRVEELKDQLEDLRETLNDTEEDIRRNQAGGKSTIRLTLEKESILREYKTLNDELVKLTDERNQGIAEENKKFDEAEAKRIADQKKSKLADKAAADEEAAQAERDKATAQELARLQEKEKKITEIAFQEAAVREAILAEQATANDEVKLAALQEREAQLTSARLQIEAERLEQLKQYDQAELLRLQDTQNKKIASTVAAEKKRNAEIQKAKEEEFALEKIAAEQQRKFAEATTLQKLRMTQQVFSDISVLARNGNRDLANIGKAAALFSIGIGIPDAAQKAYTAASIFGPVAGAAAAALAVAAGIQRLNEVRSQQLGFAEGGVVPGVGNKDTVPALLTPGEVVVPKSNFEDLQRSLQGGVTADQIVLMQQSNEIQGRILDVLTFGTINEKLTQIVSALGTLGNKIDGISIGGGFGTGGTGGAIEPQLPAEPPQVDIPASGRSRDEGRKKASRVESVA